MFQLLQSSSDLCFRYILQLYFAKNNPSFFWFHIVPLWKKIWKNNRWLIAQLFQQFLHYFFDVHVMNALITELLVSSIKWIKMGFRKKCSEYLFWRSNQTAEHHFFSSILCTNWELINNDKLHKEHTCLILCTSHKMYSSF